MAEPKKVILYPNTCKLCGSPARKCHSLTLCSNPKCNSKNTLLNSFKAKVPGGKRIPHYITCFQCSSFAHHTDNTYTIATCRNGHTWKINIAVGDMLKQENVTFKYNGVTWEKINEL